MGRSEVGPAGPAHWFEPVAEHLGGAYLRYSFTKGTENEVAFLVDALGLGPGSRVLDVGCGPGRHSGALAERGVTVVGIDIAAPFVELAAAAAPAGASYVRGDARSLPFDGGFDAAISLCQGAFGLCGGGPGGVLDGDGAVLAQIGRAVRPGGRIAVSAFSAYFQLRYLGEDDDFDADRGVNHELAELRDPEGTVVHRDLWTTVFTPRELRLLAAGADLDVTAIHAVTPGDYGARHPDASHPEFLLLAQRIAT